MHIISLIFKLVKIFKKKANIRDNAQNREPFGPRFYKY